MRCSKVANRLSISIYKQNLRGQLTPDFEYRDQGNNNIQGIVTMMTLFTPISFLIDFGNSNCSGNSN